MPARYESHYLRTVDPARPRGAWIRHTSHQRPGEPPTGALWCTLWDAEAGPPHAVKQSLPEPPATPDERFVGRAEALGRSAAWDLEAASGRPGLRHLPRAWMYRAPLPRTKLESPMPDAVFTGTIEAGGRTSEAGGRPNEAGGRANEPGRRPSEPGGPPIEPGAPPIELGRRTIEPGGPPIEPGGPPIEPGGPPIEPGERPVEAGGRTIEPSGPPIEPGERPVEAGGRTIEPSGRTIAVSGWRGVVGHNWGAEHAERWVWLHALGFAEAPGAWLDVALGRVRVAGRTTPWIANGAVELDGARLRLGGIGRARSTRVDARPGALEAVIGGAAATIRVSVAAPLDQTVAFVYADPAGGEHHVLNCSIAQVRLRVERPGRPPVELATAFGGAYELGVRETDHGLPVQPFPDP